ncbi:hypothetical protein AB4259_07390 [Vibrio amylolyticus]|uniref:hypothetical protein n=1 Tax=Vibrio amylolyticus TaxID=2847292 RepID=UPI003553778A
MLRVAIGGLLFIFTLYNVYYHTYTEEVVLEKGRILSAHCQETIKSGTFLKIKYVVGEQQDVATVLPTWITCDALLKQANDSKEKLWIKKTLDPFDRVKSTFVSIDKGITYYSFRGKEGG